MHEGSVVKSTFSGFYSTSNDTLRDIWNSGTTLFVFDTNCLLNLYRCEDHTREDIINVMNELSDRIWIPFQVGLEYQRNRRTVIEESINSLKKIKEELQGIYTKNLLLPGNVKKNLYSSLSDEISGLQKHIQTPIDEYINSRITPRIENKENISKHDFIRDTIDTIVNDKIGSAPSQDEINAIDKEGEERYKNKTPPGFKDEKKQDVSYFSNIKLQDKYGDLYLWKQLIEKSKSPDIKSVIFVCDDNKADWWYSNSGKTHGALEALKTEICRETEIENFKLINQLTFLNEAKEYLVDVSVSESSLKEVEELSHINISYINNYSEDDLQLIKSIHEKNYVRWYKNAKEYPINDFSQKDIDDFDDISEFESFDGLDAHYIKNDIDIINNKSMELLNEFLHIHEIAKGYLTLLREHQAEFISEFGVTAFTELRNSIRGNLAAAKSAYNRVRNFRYDSYSNLENASHRMNNNNEYLASKLLNLGAITERAEIYLQRWI